MKRKHGGVGAVLTAAVLLTTMNGAQAQHPRPDKRGFFLGYETLEMVMNEFSNFAGEAGYRFNEKWQARLTVMEVSLTEAHLSSSWQAAAVSGHDVEGYVRGYEGHVDWFFAGNFYLSGNVGYYDDTYRHMVLDESIENRTMTAGTGIGYELSNLFGLRGLYLNANMPVRYYFNPIHETKLGETTIRPHIVVNNLWLFVGFKF